jgi:hypothetical protein
MLLEDAVTALPCFQGLDSPARKHLVTLECFLVLPDKHQAALNVF